MRNPFGFFWRLFNRKQKQEAVSDVQPALKLATSIGFDLKSRKFPKAGFLAYSPEFKGFVKKNKGVLLPAYRLIKSNFEALQNGKTVSDKKTGITIQKAATGRHKGRAAFLTLRANIGSMGFFIKISQPQKAEAYFQATKKTESFLSKINHSFMGFNVRILKPHIFFERKTKASYSTPSEEKKRVSFSATFVVSDFYDSNEVVQVSNLRNSINEKAVEIENAVDMLGGELEKISIFDVHSINAFFDKKTNTIMLFDLSPVEWSF